LARFADAEGMNGTRTAVALTCIAALAMPSAAMAKKKTRAHKAKSPAVTVVLKHTYDAGGEGAGAITPTPGVRVNLFDPVQVATGLGNQVLGQLGLPPVTLPAV
jgi:hypothetical protein